MSYTKTQWNNNTTPAINADNLNKIEQGIYDNDSAINDTNATIGDLTDLDTSVKTDIVSAINENVTNAGDLTTLTTTAKTDLVSAINEVNAKSEIDNTYGTSQTKGYSQEYQNDHNVVVSTTEPTNKSKVWLRHGNNLFNSSGFNWATGTTLEYTSIYVGVGTYTIFSPDMPVGINNVANFFILANKVTTGADTATNGVDKNNIRTVTSTDGYLTIANRASTGNNPYAPKNYKFMINSGSTALDYEDYIYDKEYILNTNNEYTEFNPQNNVYSTTEQVIGTWIDGKPLYRKVFIVNATVPTNTATSGGSVTLLNLTTYNIDEFFIDFNRLDNANKSVSYYNPFSAGTPRYFAISKVSGNVLANFYNAFSNENVTITFSALYTKTTD